jgi:Aerotolerance regulator N-terminal/von Willebrand factor type A domain
MTFLNPAILFGLFAAAIPIALHFLNLRKLKKVEFSTLSFLKELQKTKIRKLKLKQLLLLLIRTFIIIILVAAFARPVIKTSFGNGSSSAQTSAVIVIDNTFSMSGLTVNGSQLNRAKKLAKDLLAGLRKNDDVTIIPVGETSSDELKPTSDFSSAIREIDNLQISPVSGTLNGAITAAAKVMGASQNLNREIYILTDLQKGRLYDSVKDLSDLSSSLNEKVRLYLIDLGNKQAVNAGIDDLFLNNQIVKKGGKISVGAKITNYSSTQTARSVVSLFINGKRSAQQSIELGPSGGKELSFETALNDTGLVEIYAELEDDDILLDNRRYLGIYVPDRIRVLILSDNKEDGSFVRLAAENSGALITESDFTRLSSLNLNSFDTILLFDPGKGIEYGSLAAYAESGHGLVLFPGSRSTLESFQTLCGNFGIAKPTSALGKPGSAQSVARFDKTDFQNPVFSDLFEYKTERLESPDFFFYLKTNPGSSGKNVISLSDNSSFLSEYKIGNGKIFLFTSAPLMTWNNFPMKGFFPPLMAKIVYNSAYKGRNGNSVYAGRPVDVNISGLTLRQIKVVRPDGTLELINIESPVGTKYLTYSGTGSLGIFKFFSGDRLLDYWSVNHDPRESAAGKVSYSEFNTFLKEISFGGNYFIIGPSDDLLKVVYESRFGTELWEYFMVALLLLALLESFTARSAKKDLSKINDEN